MLSQCLCDFLIVFVIFPIAFVIVINFTLGFEKLGPGLGREL